MSVIHFDGIIHSKEPIYKLEKLSQLVQGLVAGVAKEEAPPRSEAPKEQHSSSRPGAGEAEDMSAFHAKLDRLSQHVERLAEGPPREPPPPPPLMDAKLDAKLDKLSELVQGLAPREEAPNGQHGSSRPGAGEAEGLSSVHTNLERISQQVHQVALNQQMVSQQVQQQGQQQVQQQAQAFMNQRYEVAAAHTAGAGQHDWTGPILSKPQPSQASYLQKAAKRANWTPSGSIQPLMPLAGGVVLTGTAAEGDAPPPYRSAPDLPAGPPVPAQPAPPVVPAPGAPSPAKRGVSFAGGS